MYCKGETNEKYSTNTHTHTHMYSNVHKWDSSSVFVLLTSFLLKKNISIFFFFFFILYSFLSSFPPFLTTWGIANWQQGPPPCPCVWFPTAFFLCSLYNWAFCDWLCCDFFLYFLLFRLVWVRVPVLDDSRSHMYYVLCTPLPFPSLPPLGGHELNLDFFPHPKFNDTTTIHMLICWFPPFLSIILHDRTNLWVSEGGREREAAETGQQPMCVGGGMGNTKW